MSGKLSWQKIFKKKINKHLLQQGEFSELRMRLQTKAKFKCSGSSLQQCLGFKESEFKVLLLFRSP